MSKVCLHNDILHLTRLHVLIVLLLMSHTFKHMCLRGPFLFKLPQDYLVALSFGVTLGVQLVLCSDDQVSAFCWLHSQEDLAFSGYTTKEKLIPLPNNHQVSIAPRGEMGPHESLPSFTIGCWQSPFCAGLVKSITIALSSWFQWSGHVQKIEDSFKQFLPILWLLIFFLAPSEMFPKP